MNNFYGLDWEGLNFSLVSYLCDFNKFWIIPLHGGVCFTEIKPNTSAIEVVSIIELDRQMMKIPGDNKLRMVSVNELTNVIWYFVKDHEEG